LDLATRAQECQFLNQQTGIEDTIKRLAKCENTTFRPLTWNWQDFQDQRNSMTSYKTLNSHFSVAAQIKSGDILRARAQGFQAIINNRPDSEQGVLFPSVEAQALAQRHGLDYLYLPTENHMIYRDETIEGFIRALEGQEGPVLAYCKSGTRCTILWALAASRFQ